MLYIWEVYCGGQISGCKQAAVHDHHTRSSFVTLSRNVRFNQQLLHLFASNLMMASRPCFSCTTFTGQMVLSEWVEILSIC